MKKNKSDLPEIKLWFDGACWPNPGGRASYGWATSEEALAKWEDEK